MNTNQNRNQPPAAPSGQSMIDLEKLPPDLALMRIENDNIQAMASARPRDMQLVKEDVLSQLAIFPAMAAQMIYSKPVGKNDEGVMQFARNLSVRAAEMLAEAYGFNRVAAKTVMTDDMHAQVEATFVDYQRGRIWTESNPVSRVYKSRGGGTSVIPEDRFLNIVVKAERSKVIREAILRCVPPGLKQALFEAADKEMAKLLKPEHMAKIVASFASKGVSLEQLERLIGRTQKQGWLAADRQRLAELWSAIENEEATVAEIFGAAGGQSDRPDPTKATANVPERNGGEPAPAKVSGAHLSNPRGAAAPPPHPPREGAVAPPASPSTQEAAGQADKGTSGQGEEEPAAESPPWEDAEDAPPDEWLVRLEEELSNCDGIRDAKRIGEKYYGSQSGLPAADKEIAANVVARFQETIRNKRGPRSNTPQMFEAFV